MRNHYLKPENKTDNRDFTIFGMKIGPVPDLQELSTIHHTSPLQTTLHCTSPSLQHNPIYSLIFFIYLFTLMSVSTGALVILEQWVAYIYVLCLELFNYYMIYLWVFFVVESYMWHGKGWWGGVQPKENRNTNNLNTEILITEIQNYKLQKCRNKN